MNYANRTIPLLCILAFGCLPADAAPLADPELVRADIVRVERVAPRVFIEVVRPMPAFVAREKDQQDAALNGSYEQNLSVARRNLTYVPPDELKLSLAEFSDDPDQTRSTGPFIEVQVRRRSLTKNAKTWRLEKERFLSSARYTEEKVVELFSHWAWEPDCAVLAGEECQVAVEELDYRPGALNRYVGVTDHDGRLRVPLLFFLRPLIERINDRGVTLEFKLPKQDVKFACIIPREVLTKLADSCGIELPEKAPNR